MPCCVWPCTQERPVLGWGHWVPFPFTSWEGLCHHVQETREQPAGKACKLQMKIVQWVLYEILENCKVTFI